jgi:tetrapyrrole methylase family protein/MazG family protein
MSELRQGWGCPWDREQNHLSLKKYLIEEAYEVIEAIDSNNMHNLCEELGDLLLQVVFHAQIAQEDNQFSVFDVLEGISDKLVRRHPHVFGTVVAETCDEVLFNWDAIKRSEKAGQIENVNHFDIPESLPALLLAEKTQKKAAKVGFDWDGYQGPLDKVREELLELEREIGNHERLEDEFGDLLFSIVNLSRPLNLNAEDALRKGTKKFQARFNKMLEKTNEANLKLSDLTLQEMDFYWDKVKNEEKSGTLGPF